MTKYKAIVEETQRKSPKVTKFIGIKRTLIIGFIKRKEIVNPNPARSKLSRPFSKMIPEIKLPTKYNESVAIM